MNDTFEEILENIAARPDDVVAWQVLADYLLEIDDAGAPLARIQLELFKGISNPELIGDLADAMAKRPRLPHEPRGGFSALWRCGYLIRLELSARMTPTAVTEVLSARAARGLHHFRFIDDSGQHGGMAMFDDDGSLVFDAAAPSAHRLRASLEAVTPHLRRCSLNYIDRYSPLTPHEQTGVLDTLVHGLPSKVERVDLALGAEPPLAPLLALARRVKVLNLDGTTFTHATELLEGAPTTEIFLGGTGLAPANVEHPRAQWLAKEVVAWLEDVNTGAITPLTPANAPGGFEAPALRAFRHPLSLDFGGEWRTGGQLLDDGALLGSQVLRLR